MSAGAVFLLLNIKGYWRIYGITEHPATERRCGKGQENSGLVWGQQQEL